MLLPFAVRTGFALSLYYYVKRDYYIKEGSVGTSNGVLGFDSLPTTRSDKIIPQKRRCPSR